MVWWELKMSELLFYNWYYPNICSNTYKDMFFCSKEIKIEEFYLFLILVLTSIIFLVLLFIIFLFILFSIKITIEKYIVKK